MDDESMLVVVERYLAGECSPLERRRVEAWMDADPARRAHVDSLRVMGEAWAGARPRFDSQAAWRRMAARVPGDVGAGALWLSRRAPRRGRAVGMAAAAAAIAVVAVSIAVRGRGAGAPVTDGASHSAKEYATVAAQQMTMVLPDGTRLRLAPASRVVLDGDYGRATRTVQLEGQASFDVVHDAARPFRVRAGNTVAWDVGTKFTVRAYSGERVRVAVEEGSVAIPRLAAAPLVAGDLATVDSNGHGSVQHGAALGRYTAWTKGTLEFRDTPIAEAAADLSRWYGVEVRLADADLARRHITVTIAESSIDAALALLAPAVGARYERRGSTVVLYSARMP